MTVEGGFAPSHRCTVRAKPIEGVCGRWRPDGRRQQGRRRQGRRRQGRRRRGRRLGSRFWGCWGSFSRRFRVVVGRRSSGHLRVVSASFSGPWVVFGSFWVVSGSVACRSLWVVFGLFRVAVASFLVSRSFSGCFRVVSGSFLIRCLGCFGVVFELPLGSFLVRFGIAFKSFWGCFGVVFGSFLGRSWVVWNIGSLESSRFRGCFWVVLGSFEIVFGLHSGCCWIDFGVADCLSSSSFWIAVGVQLVLLWVALGSLLQVVFQDVFGSFLGRFWVLPGCWIVFGSLLDCF